MMVGADGRYSVLLGTASVEGVPQSLFHSGEARWISAQLMNDESIGTSSPNADGEAASTALPARSLLATVPYAFKSMDAETLAGREAADYVTREDLQSAVASSFQAAAQLSPQANSIMPDSAGTSGLVPVWTGSRSLGNSLIAQSGTGVGIGTLLPATLLDVNGKSTLRAAVSLVASAATMASGANSPPLQLGASAYSSASRTAVAQNFVWQAVSALNNTSSPTASLRLLFGSGIKTPEATGLSIAPNGQITFAPGQTFPALSSAAGAISAVTAGVGLNGGGSTGNVTVNLSIPVETANGGTGATTAAGALANLGAVSTRQIGGLTQADQQAGKDFGQKVMNCLTAAIATGNNVCDARNLIGVQSLSSNLVFTTSNANNMTLLLAPNVTVDQRNYQVLIEPGVTNFSVVGSGAWSTAGANGQAAGSTFSYSGTDYAWKVLGGVLNTWTYYVKLQDFAIIAPGTSKASGLYLGPEVQDVDLVRMRIALPTSNSTGYSLHIYGGAASSGMYSSFLSVENPEFVGGAGVLVDGNGLADWAQDSVFGGRLMASNKNVVGSRCVDIQAGEFALHGTDLENCDVGLHMATGGAVQPYVRPDGCCVNTGIQLDGAGAYGNYIVTTNPNNVQINGARWNTVMVSTLLVHNDLGAGGSDVMNYQYLDVPLNFTLASGKTTPQYASLLFGDGSAGELIDKWQISKDNTNGFEINDLAAKTQRLGFSPGPNGNSGMSANGSGVVSFNWASGTGGVVFGNGAETNTASISGAGVATFTGITDTGVTGAPQCAQFNSSGVLGGTGAPCAAATPAAAVAPVRWTLVGISPGEANGGPWGRYTPDVDVTIISEEYTFYGAPTGCSTYPTMYLKDNNSTIAGSAQKLNTTGNSYTGLALNVAAGHTISVSTASGVGCAGQNSGVYTITMKPRSTN
ncbi:MAG: hypothetical protein ABR956_17945 [Terracidiphilus sp.]